LRLRLLWLAVHLDVLHRRKNVGGDAIDSDKIVICIANGHMCQRDSHKQTNEEDQNTQDLEDDQQQHEPQHRAEMAMNDLYAIVDGQTFGQERMFLVEGQHEYRREREPNARKDQKIKERLKQN